MAKFRYDIKMREIINNFKGESKPTLLLHSCCAPCTTSVLDLLKQYFRVTIFSFNPNIYPKSEYDKRLSELYRFIKEYDPSINIIKGEYNTSGYTNAISGFENYGEHSERCIKCIGYRMEETCKLAKKLNFDFFTTTLSVSPWKNVDTINEIGAGLESKYGIKFLYSDFKKQEGYKKSIEMSRNYGLYRQTYCGCQNSIN